jgi:histidinol dehydrogenase
MQMQVIVIRQMSGSIPVVTCFSEVPKDIVEQGDKALHHYATMFAREHIKAFRARYIECTEERCKFYTQLVTKSKDDAESVAVVAVNPST